MTKVVLTRESADNGRLARLLDHEGIEAIDYPCIAVTPVRPPEGKAREVLAPGRYRAVIFTSRRSVPFFLEMVGKRHLPEGMIVAAVGEGTAGKLVEAGLRVDVVSAGRTGESLGKELLGNLKRGDRVLYIRGSHVSGGLAGALSGGGVAVDELVAYENAGPELRPLDPEGSYLVVCASPSAVERFVAANPGLVRSTFVAMGPVTAGRMKELGIESVAVAGKPDDESLARTILDALKGSR
jgi:uroporphyrinogen III methyltransferase/synthase